MSAIPWAPDLPQRFLQDGYSIAPVDNVIRETMDVGPPKLRRRSTIAVVRVTAAMRMTDSQRLTFNDFFRQVLFEGTIPFALDDPDGVSREYFVIAQPQMIREDLYWRVALQLEYTE